VYPSALSVHDCAVVPLYEVQGVDAAQVGAGPHDSPPLLLLPLAPLLLPLLPEQSAHPTSSTQTGAPAA
jgi:hypothetical protein